MEQLVETLKVLAPFGAALLAYLLGSRAYFRQKEFELVRSRYLEGGLDRVSAQIEEALRFFAQDFAHGMKTLRVYYEIGPVRAAQLCDKFEELKPGAVELISINRLQELVQDTIYSDVSWQLYSAVQEYHSFLVDEMCFTIKGIADSIADGKGLDGSTEVTILKSYEEKVIKGYAEGKRFLLLLSCLHEITSVLQAQRLTLVSVRDFHKQPVVAETARRLKAEFGTNLTPWEEELRKLGINQGEQQVGGRAA